jgi:hypothetical protein
MRDFTPRPKQGMPLKKVKQGLNRTPTVKQYESIKASKEYYRLAIASNIAQNKGKCICEECGNQIKEPSGSNVSHIVSKGANRELYLDPLNHFILCDIHEGHWTMHDKTTMNIYHESEERRINLNHKYYNGNNK